MIVMTPLLKNIEILSVGFKLIEGYVYLTEAKTD